MNYSGSGLHMLRLAALNAARAGHRRDAREIMKRAVEVAHKRFENSPAGLLEFLDDAAATARAIGDVGLAAELDSEYSAVAERQAV